MLVAKNPLQQEQRKEWAQRKAGRPTRQAGRRTRQTGLSIDVPTLTANIFAAATKNTNKTKQGRLAMP